MGNLKEEVSAVGLTEWKFMCLTHREDRQTKMSEFGTEKHLFQGKAKSTGSWYSKHGMVLGKSFYKQNVE